MADRKILIDTNVFIELEDQKEVAPDFAKMQELCSKYSVHLFVHEAAVEDIKRDKDVARRKVSLSKVRKFEPLTKVKMPAKTTLIASFGPISNDNDAVDVALLQALKIGAVDFIVTQDRGIHGRARRCTPSLADRVLTVADAVVWLRAAFEPKEVILPFIEEVPAHAISPEDDIFDSLREGYPAFDKWWEEKCVRAHRPCWVATIDGEVAGIIVRKEETHSEAQTRHPGPKILKICTFKVKPKFRGEKLGELLLKQILWFAEKNSFDLVYLTTFDDQEVLIQVLEYFGFTMTGKNAVGELIYEKQLPRSILTPAASADLFELARLNYPRFVCRPPADAFYVPIRGNYHDILFPELVERDENGVAKLPGLYAGGPLARKPGNTIRKVYLCRARSNKLVPGSVLVFYRSQSPGSIASQSVTSVGVVEEVNYAKSLRDLVRLTAKRSVYSEVQLAEFKATANHPVKVIDFLLIGHLDSFMGVEELKRKKVFRDRPPQSICYLSPERLEPIRRKMNFGFRV